LAAAVLVVLDGELAVPSSRSDSGWPATRYSWVEFLAKAAMWVSKPRGGVESRVRCNGCLRTPPGSEDSNGKLDVPCAVGAPGWSFNRGTRADLVRRREVHDHFLGKDEGGRRKDEFGVSY